MIIEVKLDYNPETGEVRVIGSTSRAPKVTVETEESSVPMVTLDTNKYHINQAAIDLLNVKTGDRIDIKYQKVNGVEFPIIGSDAAFGCKAGNVLSKSNTVGLRGQGNERLRRFGETFTLTALKDAEGLFVLIGDTEIPETPEEIEVVEDPDDMIDLPEETELDNATEVDESIFDFDL